MKKRFSQDQILVILREGEKERAAHPGNLPFPRHCRSDLHPLATPLPADGSPPDPSILLALGGGGTNDHCRLAAAGAGSGSGPVADGHFQTASFRGTLVKHFQPW